MPTIVQNFSSATAGNKPATTGLYVGQIAFNTPDKLMFVGDGSNQHTLVNGNVGGIAPPAGRGFYEVSTAAPVAADLPDVFTASTITVAGPAPTDAELSTAFGDPTPLIEGSTGIITGGPHKGIYVYDGTNWVPDPNNGTQVTDVAAAANVASADTAATNLGTNLSSGDVLLITDTTGLTAQTTLGGQPRQAPPTGFIEGEQPIAYIYTGSEWSVLGTPLDTQYTAGDNIVFTSTGNSVAIALAEVLTAGTF